MLGALLRNEHHVPVQVSDFYSEKTVYSLSLAMGVELLLSLASLQNEHHEVTVCTFYSE